MDYDLLRYMTDMTEISAREVERQVMSAKKKTRNDEELNLDHDYGFDDLAEEEEVEVSSVSSAGSSLMDFSE